MVRGLGPGLPGGRRSRWSTSASPSSSSICCCDRRYLHPNGQLPAYEWNFTDVNPPVHAWATYLRLRAGEGPDRQRRPRLPGERVPEAAAELHLVAQPQGRRRAEHLPGRLPRSGQHRRVRPQRAAADRRHLDQADGTAWMALYCQNMLQIAIELRRGRPAVPRAGRDLLRALRLDRRGHEPRRTRHGPSMWDEEDGFFYDVLRRPDGSRTAQGALARRADAAGGRDRARRRRGTRRFPSSSPARGEFLARHPARRWPASPGPGSRARRAGACSRCSTSTGCVGSWPGCSTRTSSSARTASGRCRAGTPSTRTSFDVDGQDYGVDYLPAESDTGMFGGNSNWRGPVWFPINVLLIRALLQPARLLRRRVHRRVPDRLGQQMTSERGGRRSSRPAGSASSCRTPTAVGRSTAASRVPATTRTGGT